MGRKTISLPEALEERIQREADRRGRSFSSTVVELLDRQTRATARPAYIGAGEGGEVDDSTRVEELLDEIVSRWRD